MFKYEDLTFRNIEEADLEALRRLRNDEDTWVFLTSPGLINPIQQEAWFEGICKDDSKEYMAIIQGDDLPDNLIGMARVDEIDMLNRSVRIGADILSQHRGEGLGQKIILALMMFYFSYKNCHKIWLEVLGNNSRAKHIYEKLGFQEDGIMREHVFREDKYMDYVIMSILEYEYRKKHAKS